MPETSGHPIAMDGESWARPLFCGGIREDDDDGGDNDDEHDDDGDESYINMKKVTMYSA